MLVRAGTRRGRLEMSSVANYVYSITLTQMAEFVNI